MKRFLVLFLLAFMPVHGVFASEALDILLENFAKTRPEYQDDPDDIVLFESTYDLLNATFIRWEKELGLCPSSNDVSKTLCVKKHLLKVAREGKKLDLFNEMIFKSLKLSSLTLNYKAGELEFLIDQFKETYGKNHAYLKIPQLSHYLRAKNYYAFLRFKKQNVDPKVDQKIIADLSDLYKRKTSKLGLVSIEEYIIANYNETQVREMGKIMAKMLKLRAPQSAKIIFDYDENNPHYEKIKEARAELNELLETLETELSQEAKNQALEQMKKLNRTINELEANIPLNQVSFELTAANIYRLTMNHFDLSINEAIRDPRNHLYKKKVTRGDVLIASYLIGELPADYLPDLLSMKELKEKYVPFWKKVLKTVAGVGKLVLQFTPATSPYVNTAIMLYGSIEKRKEMIDEKSKETHLIH